MRGGRQAVTALVALAAGLAVIACGSLALVRSHTNTTRPRQTRTITAATSAPKVLPNPAAPAASATPAATLAPVAAPVSLAIPAIAVSTRLIRLDLTSVGTLQVPDRFDVAGWYDRSPRPGATGPAVIAGHIDSVSGPAVFYRLSLLHPGDRVYVHRADGTVAVFAVTSVGLYPKDRFPTAAVYGPTPGPELRLITCGGTFDWSRHSYLSNVVVYATATT